MNENPFEKLSASYLIDLSTRVLEVDNAPNSFEEISNHHINYGSDLLLAATKKYGGMYSNVPKLSKGQLQVVAKLEHEYDHLRRVAGTSFGHLLAALFAKKIDHALRLVDWDGESQVDFVDRDHEFVKNLKRASDVREAAFVMLADSPIPGSYSAECVASALTALCNLGGGATVQLGNKPFRDILPSVRTTRGARVLGAQALLEFFAVGKESSYAAFAIDKSAVPVEDYRKVTLYNLVGAIWRDLYQFPMPVVSAESWTEDAQPLNGKRFPIELYAAVDLALWVPFTPDGWVQGMEWLDVHPGWRFLKILDLLKATDKPMTPFSSADAMTDEHFEGLQAEWAIQLGWPKASELARDWLAALESILDIHQKTDRCDVPWTISDDSWRWRGDADYLRTKIKHPGLSVITRPATHGYSHLWFQMLLAEDPKSERMNFYTPPSLESHLAKMGYTFPPSLTLQVVSEGILARADNPKSRLSRRVERLTDYAYTMLKDCRTYHSRS